MKIRDIDSQSDPVHRKQGLAINLMKHMQKFYLLIIIYFIFPKYSFSKASEIHRCFNSINKTKNLDEVEAQAQKCFEKAQKLSKSDKIIERATYLNALIENAKYKSGVNNYEYVFKTITPYYTDSVSSFITDTFVKKLNDDELRLIHSVVSSVAFYSTLISSDRSAFDLALLIFKDMKKRKIDRAENEELYRMALSYHAWSVVAELAPSINLNDRVKIPQITGEDTISSSKLLYYKAIDENLRVEEFKILNKGPQIILLAGCHFALDLMKELSSHQDISSIFKKYGFTILPPHEVDTHEIHKLNLSYPIFEAHPVVNSAAWWSKGIKTAELPTLYYLLDGEIRYQHTGSRSPVKEFCKGLSAIQMALPESCN